LSVGQDQFPSLSASTKPEKFLIATTITSLFSAGDQNLVFPSLDKMIVRSHNLTTG